MKKSTINKTKTKIGASHRAPTKAKISSSKRLGSSKKYPRSKLVAYGAYSLAFVLVLCVVGFIFFTGAQRDPRMMLKASADTVRVGEQFSVKVYADSNAVSVNAVQASVNFSPDVMELRAVQSGASHYPIDAYQQQRKDTVEIARAVPGGVTGEKLVSELQFVARKKGEYTIKLLPSSSALVESRTNTNILDNDNFSNIKIEVK